MMRLFALPFVFLAFHASIQPLPAPLRAELNGRFWHRGCPVSLSRLRVLTVTDWGFDGRVHTGQLVVNADAAAPLARVFRRLFELRFPIRHLRLFDAYGPSGSQPADGDISGSFECRQAVPSPCSGGTGTGSWSEHAYGEAVDLNPVENPYVGCGRTHDRSGLPYLDRSRLRRGMVTPAVVQAFRSIGWVGRSLVRVDQGPHALLRHRPLVGPFEPDLLGDRGRDPASPRVRGACRR